MICRDCKREFVPYHGKPGYINQCEDCGAATARKQPPLRMAKVSWEGKHTPIIDTSCTDNQEVIAFNRAQRRRGPSVGACFGRGAAAQQVWEEVKESRNDS